MRTSKNSLVPDDFGPVPFKFGKDWQRSEIEAVCNAIFWVRGAVYGWMRILGLARLGCPEQTKNMIQEFALSSLRWVIPRFDPARAFQKWFFACARLELVEWRWQVTGPRHRSAQLVGGAASPDAGKPVRTTLRLFHKRVLKQFKPALRTQFAFSFVEEMTDKELRKRLGKPPSREEITHYREAIAATGCPVFDPAEVFPRWFQYNFKLFAFRWWWREIRPGTDPIAENAVQPGPDGDDPFAWLPDPGPSPGEAYSNAEWMEQVLSPLSPEDKQILTLKHVHRLTDLEIARQVGGIPRPEIRKKLLEVLRRHVAETPKEDKEGKPRTPTQKELALRHVASLLGVQLGTEVNVLTILASLNAKPEAAAAFENLVQTWLDEGDRTLIAQHLSRLHRKLRAMPAELTELKS